ncbi:MAG: hypothetical protein IJF53_06010 [Clostridia bacterium]|nr:hypothetical protein [Clostridia bacterium]
MLENETSTTLCKSVFKSGESTTTEQGFTQIWLQVIQALEAASFSPGAPK